ncbi:MAG TPA: hypothetical protein VJZ26_02480 [Blastocatellia bacterium]|nr:hypothetical protein [Blastocatellia bacterium]
MPKHPQDYDQSVFINCPFDDEYKPLFDAIVFTVQIAGFEPRCALEASDAGQFRLEKIMAIVSECKYGIHDISRTELAVNNLPRFNMPLELGIDLGCRRFGTGKQRSKRLLIMDRNRYRYQRFISDIAGQDIKAHSKSDRQVVRQVRDWLRSESRSKNIPGGEYVFGRYRLFRKALPFLCKAQKLDEQLTFGDFTDMVRIWLEENEV